MQFISGEITTMSIINDALKKVQTQLDKQDPAPNPQPNTGTHNMENPNPSVSSSPTPNNNQKDMTQFLPQKEKPLSSSEPVILSETIKPMKKAAKEGSPIAWSQIFTGFVSVLIIAGAGYYMYTYINTQSTRTSTSHTISKKIEVSLPTPQEIKKEIAKVIMPAQVPAAPVKKSGINLNGIVASGEHFTALINDQIYEVGDIVDNREIMSITERTVELKDSEGAKSTLMLK